MDEPSRRKAVARKPRRRVRIEGNDLIYHFLQKTLLESDFEQFRELAARLIGELGIWLPPGAYKRFPLLVPYAVRDPSSRGNRSKGIPDQWGAPNADGYFRDDNSLIKGLPRSLAIRNPSNALVHGRYVGTSFVASHIWRELASGTYASRDPLTYSFVPNVVWLPSQISKLTDREGSFVQSYLQALSTKIYRDIELTPRLEAFIRPIWRALTVRHDVAGLPLPDPSLLNYFDVHDAWISRRIRTLEVVIEGIRETQRNNRPARKIVSTRYTDGLPLVARDTLDALLNHLTAYAQAVGVATS